MIKLKIGDEVPIKLKIDNNFAVDIAKNLIFHAKIKHRDKVPFYEGFSQ